MLKTKTMTNFIVAITLGHSVFAGCDEFLGSGPVTGTNVQQTAGKVPASIDRKIMTFLGHTDDVKSVAFSPDGKHVATASSDKSVRIWSIKAGKQIKKLTGHDSVVLDVVFSPDGNRIAASGGFTDPTVKIWDVTSGRELITLKGHASGILCIAFSADGKRLLSGSADDSAKVWSTETGDCLLTLMGHADYIQCVQFSPDGKMLVTGSRDHLAKIWNAVDGAELHTLNLHTYWVNGVCFSKDGSRLVLAAGDGIISVWDAIEGRELQKLMEDTPCAVMDVAFAPNGDLLSVDYRGTIKVWNGGTCRRTLTLPWRQGITDVMNAAFSPDRKQLVSGSRDENSATLWRLDP